MPVHRPGGPGPRQVQSPPKKPAFATPDPVAPSRIAARHWLVLVSFLLSVVAPTVLASVYLRTRAADQFASRVGFSIRQTVATAPQGLGALSGLASLTGLSGTAADDADILNEYLRSQELVRLIDERLDLRAIWSLPGPETDPVFAFAPPGAIEDLQRYWQRMVHVRYDAGAGLISVEVRAFAPGDAQAIAGAVFAAASAKINALSAIARDDTIRFARVDLEEAEADLTQARTAMTAFRNRTQIVDPAASLQGQMGLLGELQTQLAQALIRNDLLAGTTDASDPRVKRNTREIEVIEARIEGERVKFGIGGTGQASDAYATLVGDYERLMVERGFAEEAYVAARAAFDHARAEARRQTRYLAAHVPPTLAERAEYPQRLRLATMIAAFLLMGWTLVVLTGYSLKDRK